jgi:hypothetical protein
MQCNTTGVIRWIDLYTLHFQARRDFVTTMLCNPFGVICVCGESSIAVSVAVTAGGMSANKGGGRGGERVTVMMDMMDYSPQETRMRNAMDCDGSPTGRPRLDHGNSHGLLYFFALARRCPPLQALVPYS